MKTCEAVKSCNDVYRYGNNGKFKDNEWAGVGNHYDYGFRLHDTRTTRFLSRDPLSGKFPMLTPYQFASNSPIWASDLDGLEARIYTDLSIPIGHTFISVVDKQGVINVYTYGQYSEGTTSGHNQPLGTGVLIHYTGSAANEYIKHEFASNPGRMSVYEISDKVVNKEKIIQHYADMMKNDPLATANYFEINLANNSPNSMAVEHGVYMGVPTPPITANCTSTVIDALQSCSTSHLAASSSPVPQDLNFGLWVMSKISSNYKNVTNNAESGAKANTNSGGQPSKAASKKEKKEEKNKGGYDDTRKQQNRKSVK